MTSDDTPAVALSNAALPALPPAVRAPRYDRGRLSRGILHVGLGNFHRAHQAWYLHRLMDAGLAHDWAIVGAGVRPADATQRERLRAQDWLTTLLALDPEGRSAEVCGSMIDFAPVAPDNAPLIDAMADPAIRIVSMTVTEGGYYTDPATGALDVDHPDIAHDAANPATPRTAFGAMVAALRRRRAAGHGPFTGQCCDNLQGNGAILRRTVTTLARLQDPALAGWIEDACAFPNAMVDCIVPATGPREIAMARRFGVDDAAPVAHETFRQWVIEDDFRAGRPPWEEVGVTFTRDVHAYEAMKLRLLNGGHQIVAAPGALLGCETIAAAMGDEAVSGLLRKTAAQEIAPHVAPVPDCAPDAYLALILRRFANPEIVDTTRRVAFDGSSRQPGFLGPSIRDGLASGAPVEGLALTSALWARYCLGVREDGAAIAPNDPHWDRLQTAAQAARETPAAWLRMTGCYGDLADAPRFADAFERWLRLVHVEGARPAIRAYLAD